jgi:hypothetical protein
MYMCFIPNGFRDNSLHSSETVNKKEILRTVSNGGIHFLSGKVVTVYLLKYIFENFTVNISTLWHLCEDMACSSPAQYTVYCTVK